MKRNRIKMPTLPCSIVRQYPSTLYKDSKTGTIYTLETLQRLYGEKEVSEIKDETVRSKRWDLNYD